MKYFNPIVGLRAYLAIWVALGHGLQLAGFVVPTNTLMHLLLSGGDAVFVFMIVSGFVITNLLLSKREPYPQYIVRRFFRLYPAYVLACVAGYFIIPQWSFVVQHLPWQDAGGWKDYAQGVVDLNTQQAQHFWPHLALHAIMLHGLPPQELLDHAASTFLPAAWSISLEWQFYMLAPVVLAAIFGPSWRLFALVAAAFLAFWLYKAGKAGHYQIASSIIFTSPYFAIGIVSRLAFDFLAKFKVSAVVAALTAAFLSVSLLSDALPVVVWLVFYSFMVWGPAAGLLGETFKIATTSKPALLLGEASYSLYLGRGLIMAKS